jgi:uncharacterized protein (TIGR02099 family)
MHNRQDQPATGSVPLAVRWRRIRAAYRFCNLATHHLLGFVLKLALAVYFVFAVLFLFLRYAILPNIDYYKGNIEHLASGMLGNQVSIERIYASWSGLYPNLFLGDVVLRDAQGRQVLRLPSVSATLSWWSVPAADLRFESLEIIRPDLDIRRAPDGKLYVAGILLDTNKSKGEHGKGFDWLLAQREIVIREGRLDWTDSVRGAPELALENVNLLLRNHWRRHQFALTATPPAALGQPIDVRADFAHPLFASSISDVALWKGELFADVSATDLAAGKAYLDYPFQVSQGKGSVRAWLTLDHAKLAGFTADVGLANVTAQLAGDLAPLELARVSGRISAREQFPADVHDGKPTFGLHGHEVALSDFSLQTKDGLALPPTSFSERFVAAKGNAPETTEISAKLIDLQIVADLAGRLPLSPARRQMLADFAPRGKLRDFSAQWQGTYPAISVYRVKGQLEGLSLKAQAARLAQPRTATLAAQAAVPAIPGFENLTGSVDASERGGGFALNSRQLVLQLPSYFNDPALPFEQLNMQARWSFPDQEHFLFQVDAMDFVQDGARGSLAGSHLMPLKAVPGLPLGSVDLAGKLTGFDLKKLDRYLPMKTPPALRAWLTGALEDGMAQDVSFKLRGNLAQFPFRADPAGAKHDKHAQGEFRVAGRIENGKLNYVPGHFAKDGTSPLWPQAERISGSFVFDRARMEIRGDSARTLGVGLSNVKAVVPDLLAPEMMLEIDGSAAGALQEFLRYVGASPVLEWIAHFTDETRASGNAKLGLKLRLPLAHLLDATVQGTLQLANNDITLFNDMPPLQAAVGKIEFYEKGVNLNGVAASFLGGPLTIGGGTQRDNAIQIKLNGNASADGMRKNYPAPMLQRLAGHFSGTARYSGTILVKDRQVQVAVDSSLAGLGLDFPAPLKKAAPEALPLKFILNRQAPTEAGLVREEIKLALGTRMAARYQRQKQGAAPWQLVRGGIGVNNPVPEPDSGLTVNVSLKSLSVDAWSDLGSAIKGGARQGAEQGQARLPGPEPEPSTLSQYLVPDVMAARASELIVGERKLDNVVVGASHQRNVWQASIDSAQASGYVTWNEAASGQGLGKVTARLSSLVIPKSAATGVSKLLEGKSTAPPIPALDIVAERFELFNKPLGRLELAASNVQTAQGREWHINQLSLVNPDGNLKGSGKWVIRDGQSDTSLNFGLDIADAGKLLDRFGFPDTIRNGRGKLSGEIDWKGLPYSLDIPTLSGQIALKVEKGQFLKQDPGAAKLLGVLSLQALPRLLKLDFRDVFSEGLAFDGITANARITRGVARTDNLKMHGVAATVLMDGTADIANESTNLHVVVIPEFNLGTGPLVYALAVNPVIGLGSFLAQLFLRAPMMKALTYQMQITGPWKAPVVTKLGKPKLALPWEVPAAKVANPVANPVATAPPAKPPSNPASNPASNPTPPAPAPQTGK